MLERPDVFGRLADLDDDALDRVLAGVENPNGVKGQKLRPM